MKHVAIVLAAGFGKRMKSDIAKQYMEISGIPMICHTLRAFEESRMDEVILVVSSKDVEFVKKDIVEAYGFKKVSKVTEGGAIRPMSVYAGICAAKGADFVHIHDGARCLITPALINEVMKAVEEKSAVALAVPVKDTIRRVGDKGCFEGSMDREGLYAMQTPQSFSYNIIRDAFEKMLKVGADASVTDDVMVLETFGGKKTFLIPSDYENMKVTTPEDILLAEAIFKGRKIS